MALLKDGTDIGDWSIDRVAPLEADFGLLRIMLLSRKLYEYASLHPALQHTYRVIAAGRPLSSETKQYLITQLCVGYIGPGKL